jgi:hypothetical protein
MIRKNYEKNFTITSVRNPWDRAFSLYCFLGKAFEPKNSISPEMKMWVDYYYEVTKSDWNFNNFLASLSNLKVHPEWWFTLSTPQAAWVREPIDYVIKYETLETDFKKIREIFNNDNKVIPTLKMYDHPYYKDHYNSIGIKLIGKLFQEDIDCYKYTY